MKKKEEQIAELMKDKEFVKLVKLIENTQPFYVETIALRVYDKYQPRLSKDSIVISRKDYERLNMKYISALEKLERLSEDANQIKSTALEGLYMSHSDIENIAVQSSKKTAASLLSELYYIARLYYGDSANILSWAKDKATKLGVEIKE